MEFFSAFLNLVPVTLAQSLIYSFVALGIMIPFRLLSFPDLTSEGAFPLGGSVCAALILAGYDPLFATLAATVAGVGAGATTALIHLRFRINSLLAGILVFTALYSVNMRVMGRSNVAMFSADSVFLRINPSIISNVWLQIACFGAFLLVALLALRWYLATQAGAALRVVGINPDLAPSLGISVWTYTIIGLGMASGLTAFGGALVVQQQGYADVGDGDGHPDQRPGLAGHWRDHHRSSYGDPPTTGTSDRSGDLLSAGVARAVAGLAAERSQARDGAVRASHAWPAQPAWKGWRPGDDAGLNTVEARERSEKLWIP